jgi:hypothetical protein
MASPRPPPVRKFAVRAAPWAPAMARTMAGPRPEQVFSNALVIFAPGDLGMLAILSGAPHYWWAINS